MFKKSILSLIFIFCFSGFILAQGTGDGIGPGAGTGIRTVKVSAACTESNKFTDKNNQTFAVLSKSPANYTDAARQNNVQGTVTLKVTFLKTGKMGKIKVIKGLPYGLTRQAINAAKKICFRPLIVNGKAKDVVKQTKYNFTLY